MRFAVLLQGEGLSGHLLAVNVQADAVLAGHGGQLGNGQIAVTLQPQLIPGGLDGVHADQLVLGVADDAMVFKIVLDTIKNDLASYKSWKETQNAA